MLRSIIRVCGLALVLGVLALAPLTALADHVPGYTTDDPDLFHGTVVTPNRGEGARQPSYHDEGEPSLGHPAPPLAQYAQDSRTAIERIVVAGYLTWNMDTIRFLEANVWEFSYAEPISIAPGFTPREW